MTRTVTWDSALVLGGGYAGLLAARVLTGHFRHVTILEQDAAPGTQARPGVPQSHHPHALLARGAAQLEEFFPGIRAELLARGCPVADFAQATRILFPTGWAPRTPVGVDVQLMARTVLEQAVRERVTALEAVTVRDALRVERLLFNGGGNEIGVAVRPRPLGRAPGGEGDEVLLSADLVVDATGRGSRLPHWLTDAGHQLPDSLEVDARASYASRLYTLKADPDRDWNASYQPTMAPASPRGAVAVRIAPTQWLIGLIGAAGITLPDDEDGFRAYAADLRNPDFLRIIDEGEPAGPIHRTHTTINRWHPYHRVRNWPDRLIALGDSVCAFNPVYGQGMTVAALQSRLLDNHLTRHARTGRLDGLGPAFQRGAAAQVRSPWLLNTATDRAWQDTTMPLTSRLATGYLAALTARLPHHPGLYRRFVRTLQMLDSPATLASPRALAQLASLPSIPRHQATCTCPNATP
ncbi:FAD-dependent oxidoreductase [Kitasatospora sp. NPDC091257]|uniref:FAD-dependent oxidoreductase n=1 Tax=Kitasatospora sp. NPDC091257 TaxID=3364084 RepID=UPI0038157ADE